MSALRPAFALLVALVMLAGCAGMMPEPDRALSEYESPLIDDAEAAIAVDDLVSATTLLQMAAMEAPEPASTQLALEAAVLALALGDETHAEKLLQANRRGGDARASALQSMLETQLASDLSESRRSESLARLERRFSPRIAPWHAQWLAQAYLQSGQSLAAFDALLMPTQRAGSIAIRLRLEALLWRSLMQTPVDQLTARRDSLINNQAAAWLDLAIGVKANWLDTAAMRIHLWQWRERNATSQLLERITAMQRAMLNPPRKVAVLLPLSGDLQAAGEAVRRGILAAHYASLETTRPELRFFDVGPDGMNAAEAYQQAVTEGAGLVIGPLAKAAVNRLLSTGPTAVPVIALNRAEAATNQSEFYQFGLAPEEDARAIAALAIERGHQRLLTFSAADSWGARVATAFTTAFEQAGGEIIDRGRFPLAQEDLAEPIRALLHLDRSDARSERLRQITGERFRHEPRRRQDIDGIFIGAFEDSARLIVPQLRFHRAFELPVFATAQSYPNFESEVANDDLAGMWMPRLPWLLNEPSDPLDRDAAQQLANALPSFRPGPLTALGIDSYRLLYGIEALAQNPALQKSGATGRLSVDGDGRIQRQLPVVQVTTRGLRRTNNWLP